MTFSTINVGTTDNDGTGDKLRVAFTKINNNFSLITGQVDIAYLSATLSNYTTKNYVDTADANLQSNINGLISGYQTLGGEISSLQIQVDNLNNSDFATLTQLNNSVSNINNSISSTNTELGHKIDEAPNDGTIYGRRDANWVPVTGGGSSNYKVYSAIINQDGHQSDTIEIDHNNGDLVIGRTYRIIDNNNDTADFTNVGAPRNSLGTFFMATGITPASWGQDQKGKLSFDPGVPVFIILENTIGNIVWYYASTGDYRGDILDAHNTPIDTFFQDKTPTLNYITGPVENNDIRTITATRVSNGEIVLYQYDSNFNLVDGISNAFIEIRVYN